MAQLSTASARAGAEADTLRRRAEEAEAQLSTARAAVNQLQRVRALSVLSGRCQLRKWRQE